MNTSAQRHLDKAAQYVARGDEFYRKAGEEILAARGEGATWVEIADRLGHGTTWCQDIANWTKSPANDTRAPATPFAREEGESQRRDNATAVRVARERPEEFVAALDEDTRQKLHNVTEDDRRETDAAMAPLNRAVNSFASLSIVQHIDQATEDINSAVTGDGLTPEALDTIADAVERLEAAIEFAKQMAGAA